MQLWSLHLVAVLAVLAGILLLADLVSRARSAARRRRRAQGGIYGVVVDAYGRVLWVYVDPMAEPRRAARMHGPGSVWTRADPTGAGAWAWEGQAETEEEARHMANRLRHLHISLRPELREFAAPREEGEEES